MKHSKNPSLFKLLKETLDYEAAARGKKIESQDDVVGILNTFDLYAEMSDNPKKGNEMYDVVRSIATWAKGNTFTATDQLTDKGKRALERHGRVMGLKQ